MIYSILLQAQQGTNWTSLLPIVAVVIVFYFFMIRPQQKKAKEQKKFVEAIKKGDHVVTAGGIHGRIADMDTHTIILEVEKGGRIKCNKSALSMESTKMLSTTK